MASFYSSLVVMLVVLVSSTTFTFAYPSFGTKITDPDLMNICALSRRPLFCFDTLKGSPSDFQGLCEAAIRAAFRSGARTISMLDALAEGTISIHPELRKRYAACSKHFNDYIGTMNRAREKLKVGDPIAVNLEITGEGLTECKNEFQDCPVKDPSWLPNGIADAYDLEIIVIIIAGRVPRK